MCGIVAISSPSASSFHLEHCLSAIRHRGPDDLGTFVAEFGDGHLGHVRLSILDVSSAGHQPMADASGRFLISYNGEVYNYRELQSALVARFGNIHWQSGTDTEVIIEGFAREGVPFLDRLNGIFALAIYDKRERLMYVLRDPIGVKPLFVAEQQGSVFFCSELKGLLALPQLQRTLRQQSLFDQLAFMYVPEPFTLYEEFKTVTPGTCIVLKEGKQVGAQPLFAHLHSPLGVTSESEAIECLRKSFATAVDRQLISDVPISLFLSGGLDSSAVGAQAVQNGASIDTAYTIATSKIDLRHDQQSDDLRYAELIARQLGLKLQVVPARQEFLDLLPELTGFMEDGFTDPAAINTYLISQAARNAGIKVMLSGHGADEYLGGYRRYRAERLLANLPHLLRVAMAQISKVILLGVPDGYNAFRRRLNRLSNLAARSPVMRLLGMYTWTDTSLMERLLPGFPHWTGADDLEALFDTYSDDDIVDAMMKVDQHYDLMSLNLCYTDRMSMAVGVEARVPFLDFDLVQLMNSIPVGLKLKNGEGKYISKKAMESLLPKELIYREKAGFGLPLRGWLAEDNNLVSHYLNSSRLEKQGLFSPAVVRGVLDEHRRGIGDHTNTLFTLLCQQLWLERSGLCH